MADALLEPTFVITAVSALAVLLALVGILLPYIRPDPMAARLRAVGDRRRELRARQVEVQQRRSKLRRTESTLVRRLVDGLKLRERLAGDGLRTKLVQAGWRNPNAVPVYLFARFAGPLLLGGFAAYVLFGTSLYQFSGLKKALFVGGATLFAFLLPALLTTNAIQKRQMVLAHAFPDALDLLLICVESGLSLEAAFGRVAQEFGSAAPEIAEEFELATAELAYMTDRRQALDNLYLRTGLPEVKAVCTTMIQAEKYGTPLARALKVSAEESRNARMAVAEKKAAALPAKLTVPMILFFLPALFIVILGPAIISLTSK
ncbi:type II secretion system F family protein [Azospirillum sp. SYSU D00513]|uniref:type II secretion system F family protein n=1 Tax=Azospirillum sp. SYSU D00513 TaxID=2812561 RepID=UPI001A9570D9|nr:type II secretion system F family protein [Azospirillum sp. SYSU D00513]